MGDLAVRLTAHESDKEVAQSKPREEQADEFCNVKGIPEKKKRDSRYKNSM
jgi:hypothetical protein